MPRVPNRNEYVEANTEPSRQRKSKCGRYCVTGLLIVVMAVIALSILSVAIQNSHTELQSLLDSSNFQFSIGMRNDFLLQDCRGDMLKKSFPDLDYALMGYNVLKGYPMAIGHDPGFTQPIFKANYTRGKQSGDCKFSIPDGYIIVPDVSCQTSFTSETIQNSQELKQSMGILASISGGGWGASFSASASYRKASESLQSGKTVYIISRATCQYYFARIDEVTPPPFHDSFGKWIQKLNNSTNDKDFLDFIAYYGTHFMKTVTFGARYVYQHKTTSESFKELQSQKISVEAQASYSGAFSVAGSAGYNNDQSSAVEKFNEKVETETITVGSAPPSNGDAMTWASTVKETPVPFKYEMASIVELFSEAYMKSYKDINYQRLRDYFENIQMRYSTQIYRRSMSTVCRVYNSAFPLKQGICLTRTNHIEHAKEVQRVEDCAQLCLKNDACVGNSVHIVNNKNWCLLIHNDMADAISVYQGKQNDCNSTIFPYRLQSTVDKYKPVEIPGRITFTGIKLNFDKVEEKIRQKGGYIAQLEWKKNWHDRNNATRVHDMAECERKCLKSSTCVIAVYDSSMTLNCIPADETALSDTEISTSYDENDQFTFIKTCL